MLSMSGIGNGGDIPEKNSICLSFHPCGRVLIFVSIWCSFIWCSKICFTKSILNSNVHFLRLEGKHKCYILVYLLFILVNNKQATSRPGEDLGHDFCIFAFKSIYYPFHSTYVTHSIPVCQVAQVVAGQTWSPQVPKQFCFVFFSPNLIILQTN